MRTTLLLAICMAWIGTFAKGHEFWIDPQAFQVAPGTPVVAALRVGTGFEGAEQSFIPRNFARFDYVQDDSVRPVPGTVGDRPAARVDGAAEGLLVLVHQTRDLRLIWDSWEKFEAFLRHKDAAWVLGAHRADGLDRDRVREIYSRYAKALVAVGAGAGSDRPMGLLTELVALENPYAGGAADGLSVELLYQGQPRAAAQIEVFERAPGGGVQVFTLRTDGAGRANVPVRPGHAYMLDAVVLRRATAVPATGQPPDWESLWANLTFAVPD